MSDRWANIIKMADNSVRFLKFGMCDRTAMADNMQSTHWKCIIRGMILEFVNMMGNTGGIQF